MLGVQRCDGETPICGPCSRARKPVDCTYSDPSASHRRSALLQKGAACLPCRCDAKRPCCNTCHAAGKEYECAYDEASQQHLANALLTRTLELEERLAQFESQDQQLARVASGSSSSESDRSSSPGEQPLIGNVTRSLFQDIASLPGGGSGLICQNTFQLRSLFLKHQTQLGFYFRESKLNAIRNGDFSGQVIHPSMVHAAQLLGSLLWRAHTKTDVLVVNEEVEMGAILNSLSEPPDSATLVVIYCLLAWYTLYLRQIDPGREYMAKAANVLISNNLQLTPPHMDDVLMLEEPDEDTKEYITAVGQYIYNNRVAQMILGWPSFLDEEYDRQLKSLSFMQPWLAKHSIVLMRCKSLILFREAMGLSQIRADTAAATSAGPVIEHTALPSEWYTRYWETLEEVTSHVALLYPQMLQASLCSDPQHALCLKVCLIIALAAQVDLHRMPGTYHLESRQKVLSVILDVIGLTKSLKDEDYAMLEPIIGICFTVIANAIRNDRELLISISPRQGAYSKEQEAFNVLINSAQQLATKLPYVEYSLQELCDIASTGTARPQ
ncbi:uncharacterized protein PHACADRAFT_161409 [Phanerochaete carnosa HHB-10118-sp]|uniref:Zn(2)-C6 fungal-type domain-containing protein n=1 Tax=Phanerochaete carnosa (strain HHB-10118-sp) TaxID=650164 RepID=K5VV84_PHACS|nr:uncharacterized protein PHACADRAFT_161409 [Phanerochaete carnosa HHB-10118-sp]EKM55428.1 hypothetical protein PHACADRAFT_161409 [Phanerochaete carnosa HHB-10118-sp]